MRLFCRRHRRRCDSSRARRARKSRQCRRADRERFLLPRGTWRLHTAAAFSVSFRADVPGTRRCVRRLRSDCTAAVMSSVSLRCAKSRSRAVPTFQMQYSMSGVGNLSVVVGQKRTLQGMAGRTNFLPRISFPCCLWCWNLGIYGILIRLNSWFSQFVAKTQDTKYSTSTVRFLKRRPP